MPQNLQGHYQYYTKSENSKTRKVHELMVDFNYSEDLKLKDINRSVAIETSGCYPLDAKVDWYTFSPKKFKKPCAEAYEKADELKIVIYHKSDFRWALKHAEKVSSKCLLYIQPEWSKKEELIAEIVDFVKSNKGWRISLQTHKFMNIP